MAFRFIPLRCAILLLTTVLLHAEDQPQWGEAWSRNMVSDERGLPASFDPASGKNMKWSAKLGSEAHSTPVIANGRVIIGTNNDSPRDPKHQGDRGVLMCFDEKDGTLLWQLVVPKREEDPYYDWPKSGISSPATVEGDRVYVVSNRGEALCLDLNGMKDGNDGPFTSEGEYMTRDGDPLLDPGPLDADVVWRFDLTEGAGIWSHDAAHSSVLVLGDHLYLNTGTGVDNTHVKIRRPDAPSLIVLDKNTGEYLARDNEGIGPNIFHCTWSAPSMGVVNGKRLIFFAGGDGIIYAFEPIGDVPRDERPAHLTKVWEFDPDPTAPKEDVHKYNQNRAIGPSNVFGVPVFHDNKIYVAGGGDYWWGKLEAWIKCIDATQTGDVTKTAEVWSFPLERQVMSSPAVYEDMVFIADSGRFLYCMNAKTGELYWKHEMKGDPWASPYVADGKVYIGTRRNDFWVFEASKEKKLLSMVELNSQISATAVAANGVLYVATMTHLYAVAQEED